MRGVGGVYSAVVVALVAVAALAAMSVYIGLFVRSARVLEERAVFASTPPSMILSPMASACSGGVLPVRLTVEEPAALRGGVVHVYTLPGGELYTAVRLSGGSAVFGIPCGKPVVIVVAGGPGVRVYSYDIDPSKRRTGLHGRIVRASDLLQALGSRGGEGGGGGLGVSWYLDPLLLNYSSVVGDVNRYRGYIYRGSVELRLPRVRAYSFKVCNPYSFYNRAVNVTLAEIYLGGARLTVVGEAGDSYVFYPGLGRDPRVYVYVNGELVAAGEGGAEAAAGPYNVSVSLESYSALSSDCWDSVLGWYTVYTPAFILTVRVRELHTTITIGATRWGWGFHASDYRVGITYTVDAAELVASKLGVRSSFILLTPEHAYRCWTGARSYEDYRDKLVVDSTSRREWRLEASLTCFAPNPSLDNCKLCLKPRNPGPARYVTYDSHGGALGEIQPVLQGVVLVRENSREG